MLPPTDTKHTIFLPIPPTQVKLTGEALSCSADTGASRTGAGNGQDEAAANGGADANGSTGNDSDGSGVGGASAANGKLQHPPRQGQEEQNQQVFALSNTEDNDSIQGLVRSGCYLWIGRFCLPPAQPGEDEAEVRKK